jgi:hypothetical protein
LDERGHEEPGDNPLEWGGSHGIQEIPERVSGRLLHAFAHQQHAIQKHGKRTEKNEYLYENLHLENLLGQIYGKIMLGERIIFVEKN